MSANTTTHGSGAMTTDRGAPPAARPTPPAEPRGAGVGTAALILTLVGVIGATLVGAVIGGSVGPMEMAHGYYFTDTPVRYQVLVAIGLLSMTLWLASGLVGLILGIMAAAVDKGRKRGIAAIVLAVLGPVLVLGVSMAALAIGASWG